MSRLLVEVWRDLEGTAPYEVSIVAPDGWRGLVATYESRALANKHARLLRSALRLKVNPGETYGIAAIAVAR